MVVLVVDDDAVSRLVIEHILQGGGHETAAVESAEAAADYLRTATESIDLIVCDYLMPGANGLDLLEELCTESPEPVPPFILLTGVSNAADLDDARVERVSGYLTKPVKSSELLKLVESLVGASETAVQPSTG